MMDHFVLMAAILLACIAPDRGTFASASSVETSIENISGRPSAAACIEGVVRKTVTNFKLRLSVMVGLEGSGHYCLLAAYDNMFDGNGEMSIDATECISITPYFTEISMVESPASYLQKLDHATAAMRRLAVQAGNVWEPGHISALCHFISYPTDFGLEKVMQYLNLRLLAEVAEAAGVDLRVIYMKRSAHDVVVANTVHRNFQMTQGMDPATTPKEKLFIKYMRVLQTDIAVVQSMLSELYPAFIVCHDYAHAGDRDQASRIAHFVAPNDKVADMYEAALVDEWTAHSEQQEDVPIPSAHVVVGRLQRMLDTFEPIYCPSGP